MKITKVETVELRQSTEVHWGVIGWLWVRVHTDEGIIGLGETCPASAVEKAVVLNDLAPRLIGRDPRDIESIWHDLLMAVQYRGWAGAEIRAISAIDVALWDLLAKSVNLPVYRLARRQILGFDSDLQHLLRRRIRFQYASRGAGSRARRRRVFRP